MQTLTFVPTLSRRPPPPLFSAPDGAHRARGFAADVTGKVSNSGARPPETGFTLLRYGKIRLIVARFSLALCFALVAASRARDRRVPHTLHPVLSQCTPHSTLNAGCCLSCLSKIALACARTHALARGCFNGESRIHRISTHRHGVFAVPPLTYVHVLNVISNRRKVP